MLRSGLVVVALLGVLLGDADARRKRTGKRGKVVRVERSTAGSAGTLRSCALTGSNMAVCYGRMPKAGDHGAVIDGTTNYGEARILTITPQPDSCGNITAWNVTLEPSSPQITQLSYGPIVLLDYPSTAQTRTLPTSGQVPVSSKQGETQYVTIDAEGDGDADVYITAYTCDQAANVIGYGSQYGYCMGYWVDGPKGWNLLRTDIVQSC